MLLLLAIFACKDPIPRPDAQDSADTEVEFEAPDYLAGIDCGPDAIDSTADPATGECYLAEQLKGGIQLSINANCTDPAITALGSKRHLVMVPNETRPVLWLHLGGSGGDPSKTTTLGSAAMSSGYRYISLAYTNAPGVGEHCRCEEGPRPVDCAELTRAEILTGQDLSPYLEMESDEAIEYRLLALLTYLNALDSRGGWETFLTDEGEIDWRRIAVSGFSQGGGHAGMIARDHAVNRALYFSSGADSALLAMTEPSTYQSCTSDQECGEWACCPFDDLNCTTAPVAGGLCNDATVIPWANSGPDTNGDGLGDANASKRVTPPERQFAAIHRSEPAWQTSPEVFELWGMGDRYIDLDTEQIGYSVDAQLFSLDLEPNTSACSAHQSMGTDACLSIHPATSQPALLPLWRFVMDLELD